MTAGAGWQEAAVAVVAVAAAGWLAWLRRRSRAKHHCGDCALAEAARKVPTGRSDPR
jgi:hypothetical protein